MKVRKNESAKDGSIDGIGTVNERVAKLIAQVRSLNGDMVKLRGALTSEFDDGVPGVLHERGRLLAGDLGELSQGLWALQNAIFTGPVSRLLDGERLEPREFYLLQGIGVLTIDLPFSKFDMLYYSDGAVSGYINPETIGVTAIFEPAGPTTGIVDGWVRLGQVKPEHLRDDQKQLIGR